MTETPPNFLFLITDQQHIDTIAGLGATDLYTPNLDRLARRGVSFSNSYCTNPVCAPARSSLFTGRMSSETGAWTNGPDVAPSLPNLGHVLGAQGYDCCYTGKWHVGKGCFTRETPGFKTITTGINGQGHICDSMVSRGAEAFLMGRRDKTPFLLVSSYLQPHDVCQFGNMRRGLTIDDRVRVPEEMLPELPGNFFMPERECQALRDERVAYTTETSWSDELWRYYIWGYYRMVEQVDAEIGRVLDALEASGLDENTVVIFTSDHGEGKGHHKMMTKNFLYEEAVKVPMIVSWPGHVAEGVVDGEHLVSGLDIVPTICDWAGVEAPKNHGLSMRPLAEGRAGPTHDYLVMECRHRGRAVRTRDMKYIEYVGDSIQHLFDANADPLETQDLAADSAYAGAVTEHATIIRDWEARLDQTEDAAIDPESLAVIP